MIAAGRPEMRLAGILLGYILSVAPAAAQLVDRDAVFERAVAVAAVALPDLEPADLALFHIGYDLTLLESGNPAGAFEVVLLLKSSREVLAAQDVIAAAADTEAAARLGELLAATDFAWHYRTIHVHFPETADEAISAEYSTLLLNRDPDAAPSVVSSQLTKSRQ